MSHRAITALTRILRGHVGLGKERLETLCMLVVGMVGARTVNLGHVATEAGRDVLIASTYRRLQRFFQHVDLGPDWAAPLIARLIGPDGAWILALDRTAWKIGNRDVNYLVLAVITRRFRVPLFWTPLKGPGNSPTAARVDLMRRYLAHFPLATIRLLLADREFIGTEWLKFLNDTDIPFAIRLREDLRLTTEDGCELTLRARLRRAGRTRFFQARLGTPTSAVILGFLLSMSFQLQGYQRVGRLRGALSALSCCGNTIRISHLNEGLITYSVATCTRRSPDQAVDSMSSWWKAIATKRARFAIV